MCSSTSIKTCYTDACAFRKLCLVVVIFLGCPTNHDVHMRQRMRGALHPCHAQLRLHPHNPSPALRRRLHVTEAVPGGCLCLDCPTNHNVHMRQRMHGALRPCHAQSRLHPSHETNRRQCRCAYLHPLTHVTPTPSRYGSCVWWLSISWTVRQTTLYT